MMLIALLCAFLSGALFKSVDDGVVFESRVTRLVLSMACAMVALMIWQVKL